MILQKRQSGITVRVLRSAFCVLRSAFYNRGAGDALEVAPQADHSEPRRSGDQLLDRCGLTETDLEHQRPARLQAMRSLLDEPPDHVEAVNTRKQRDRRLIIADFGLERRAIS